MDFYIWMEQQKSRQDTVGKLARQLIDDPVSPRWSNRLTTYRCYLVYRDSEAEFSHTLESAFHEWKKCEMAEA